MTFVSCCLGILFRILCRFNRDRGNSNSDFGRNKDFGRVAPPRDGPPRDGPPRGMGGARGIGAGAGGMGGNAFRR